jgi:hypothetical protein
MAEPAAYLSKGEAPKRDGKGAKWWLGEIGRSRKHWREYRERAQKVVDRYRDEKRDAYAGDSTKFNILYSNVETLRPAVYSHVPNPDVRRRFLDRDPVGRLAAQILQRGLTTLCERDMEGTLGACAQDFILPGFAVARVKYAPVLDGDAIVDEDAPTEYVGWDKFAMSKSPTWERVWWVGFLEEVSKDEFIAAFGEGSDAGVSFANRKEGDEGEEGEGGTAKVWEVWNKRANERFFVAEGCDRFIRGPEPAPLKLERFFPCARPLWALATPGTLIPIPEYAQYQDLAIELDDVTERIHVLMTAVRVRGFFDGSLAETIGDVGRMGDNEFKAVPDWARLVDKGGLANVLSMFPIDQILKALDSLYAYRDRLLQTIYEVTGMADVVRGASNPNETATAQQIKGRYAGLRLGERQRKFQEFARDLIRLKAEVMAEHFQPETLAAISGIELPTAQQKQAVMAAQQAGQQVPPEMAAMVAKPAMEEVVALLRSDRLRGFRVDVETDSTIQPNADEERQQRIDLVSSIANAVQAFVPAIQSGLIGADLAKELVAFSVRSFKTAPQVEEALDAMGQQPTMPPQVQQAMQQIQAKEQELAKREAEAAKLETAAKDAAHAAQLERERAQRQESEAASAKRMLEMAQQFITRLDALEAKHDEELRRLAEGAEAAVVEAIGATAPQPVEVAQ